MIRVQIQRGPGQGTKHVWSGGKNLEINMTAIFGVLKRQGVSFFCITVENEPRIHEGHHQKSCQILKLDKEWTSQIGDYVKAELR